MFRTQNRRHRTLFLLATLLTSLCVQFGALAPATFAQQSQPDPQPQTEAVKCPPANNDCYPIVICQTGRQVCTTDPCAVDVTKCIILPTNPPQKYCSVAYYYQDTVSNTYLGNPCSLWSTSTVELCSHSCSYTPPIMA